jgi:protein disulfide-isomerase A1
VFIAYLAAMDEQLKKSFTSVAKRNRHRFSFGISTDPALAMAENIALGCIVYYNNMHKEQEMLCGENGIADLERWAEKVTMPLIGEMTRRNELRYLNVGFPTKLPYLKNADTEIRKSGKSLIYIFAFTENERKKYREELRPLAKKYEEYLSFVTIDAGEYAHMAPSLGLEEGVFPALAVMNSLMGQVFPFPNGREIEAKTVEAFVLDIVSGKTQPHTPSQSIVHDEM